ncbi:hypothetical protein ALON55S_08710 [Alishewanella longhuensis]
MHLVELAILQEHQLGNAVHLYLAGAEELLKKRFLMGLIRAIS